MIYKNDLIPEDYTLVDIAYHYNWRRDQPMQFFYRIFKKTKVLLKRRKRKMKASETVSSGVETSAVSKKPKSSSLDSDKEQLKKSNANHQPPTPSINSNEGVRTCQTTSTSSVSTLKSFQPVNNHKTSNSPPQLTVNVSNKSHKNGGKAPSPNSIKISTKKSGSPLSNIYGKTTSEKFECLISSTTATSPPRSETKKSSPSSMKQDRDPIPLIKLPTSPIKFSKREIENSVHTISFSSPLLGPPTIKKLKLDKNGSSNRHYSEKKLPLEDTIGNIVREITKNDIVKDAMKIQSKNSEHDFKSNLTFTDKKQVNSSKPFPKPNFNGQMKDSLNNKVKGSSAIGFPKVINTEPKRQKENVGNLKVSVNSGKCTPTIKINTNSASTILSNGTSKSSSTTNGTGSTTLTPSSKHLMSSPLTLQSSTGTAAVTKGTTTSLSPNKTSSDRKGQDPKSPSSQHKPVIRNGASGTNNSLSTIVNNLTAAKKQQQQFDMKKSSTSSPKSPESHNSAPRSTSLHQGQTTKKSVDNLLSVASAATSMTSSKSSIATGNIANKNLTKNIPSGTTITVKQVPISNASSAPQPIKTTLTASTTSKVATSHSSMRLSTSSTSLKDFVQASTPSSSTIISSISTVAKATSSAISPNSSTRLPSTTSTPTSSTSIHPKTTSPNSIINGGGKSASGLQSSQPKIKPSNSLLSDLRNFRKIPLKSTSPSQTKSTTVLTNSSPTISKYLSLSPPTTPTLPSSPTVSKFSAITSKTDDGTKVKLTTSVKSPTSSSNKLSPPHISPKPILKPIAKPATSSPVTNSNFALLGSQNTLSAALNNSGSASSAVMNANNIAQMAAAIQATSRNLGLAGVLPGLNAAQTAAIAQAAEALSSSEHQKAAAAMHMLRIPMPRSTTASSNLNTVLTTPSILGTPSNSLSFSTASQLPSSRLQLKVRTTDNASKLSSSLSAAALTSSSPLQSSLYTHQMAEYISRNYQSLAAAQSIAAATQAINCGSSIVGSSKLSAMLPKTLNQGMRQIPNPSLLTKQQNNSSNNALSNGGSTKSANDIEQQKQKQKQLLQQSNRLLQMTANSASSTNK